jgi:hypothetical protein
MYTQIPGFEWFRAQLTSPSSQERAQAARAAGEAGALDLDGALRALLADTSPYLVEHAGTVRIAEVRMAALAGLQAMAAVHNRPLALDAPLQVRRALPAAEAEQRAAECMARLPAWRQVSVQQQAEQEVMELVQPRPGEEGPLVAYRVLQVLGEVPYRTEQIDPATGLTPLQLEIRQSQLSSERPRPHLRFATKGAPNATLGYLLATGGGRYALDFAEDPPARAVEQEVEWTLTRLDPSGVPAVRCDSAGEPVRAPDGSFVLDGTLDLTSAPPLDVLRSVRAFALRVAHVELCA